MVDSRRRDTSCLSHIQRDEYETNLSSSAKGSEFTIHYLPADHSNDILTSLNELTSWGVASLQYLRVPFTVLPIQYLIDNMLQISSERR
jgi:hypothetical protein